MDLHELITPDQVMPSLSPGSKKQLLRELGDQAERFTGVPSRTIFDTLLERERLGSTGVGNGIAIPHGKIRDIDRIFGLFVRLDEPVEFDAVDEQPVDIVFLLLAPESAGAEHLKALSRVARVLRDGETTSKLRETDDATALYELLGDVPNSSAA